jgi:hypothetical protein
MNQFDRAAHTIVPAFSNEAKLALASLAMDFSEPDNAPGDLLNRVICHSVKGYGAPYPSIPQTSCIPAIRKAGPARIE